MTELWRVLRQPRVSTSLTLGAAAVAGMLVLVVGWRGVAATLSVPTQVPFLVSGSIGGLTGLGAALALLAVHLERSEAAVEREAYAQLQREALGLLAAAPVARVTLAARRSAAASSRPAVLAGAATPAAGRRRPRVRSAVPPSPRPVRLRPRTRQP